MLILTKKTETKLIQGVAKPIWERVDVQHTAKQGVG